MEKKTLEERMQLFLEKNVPTTHQANGHIGKDKQKEV